MCSIEQFKQYTKEQIIDVQQRCTYMGITYLTIVSESNEQSDVTFFDVDLSRYNFDTGAHFLIKDDLSALEYFLQPFPPKITLKLGNIDVWNKVKHIFKDIKWLSIKRVFDYDDGEITEILVDLMTNFQLNRLTFHHETFDKKDGEKIIEALDGNICDYIHLHIPCIYYDFIYDVTVKLQYIPLEHFKINGLSVKMLPKIMSRTKSAMKR